ncbi:hypothetical protein MTO96_026597 [Rhipicephalus appendiculatus]
MEASVPRIRHLLSVLSWGEIDDVLLSNEERRLLIGDDYFYDLEYELRHKSERDLFRYWSRCGLLDIERIDVELFKLQFRFEKEDFGELASALLVPEAVVSAQNVTVPGRTALCLTLRRLAYRNRWCDLENIFGILESTGIYSKLERLVQDDFVIYGDPAYPLLPLITKPYGGNLTP